MIHRNESRQLSGKSPHRLGDAAQFFRSWAEKPLQMGSVTPSSRTLSRAIAESVNPQSQGPVVEMGPGTGPVTQALIERGIAEDRLVLVEYSAQFCELLSRRFPKATIVRGDAYALARTLDGMLPT